MSGIKQKGDDEMSDDMIRVAIARIRKQLVDLEQIMRDKAASTNDKKEKMILRSYADSMHWAHFDLRETIERWNQEGEVGI